MKKILWGGLLLLMCGVGHARFARFVRVAPGIGQERPAMSYAIPTDPALTMVEMDDDTVLVTVPLKNPPRRTNQVYWKIVCGVAPKEARLDFREYVWKYGRHQQWRQSVRDNDQLSAETKEKLLNKPAPAMGRIDVVSIERLNAATNGIAVKIPKEEITRAYIYRDYPQMVMDGGYYYCYDLPAFFKRLGAKPSAH